MAIRIINTLFEVLQLAIVFEVVLSWVPNGRQSKVWYYVRSFTAPIMGPCEKINDKIFSGFPVDFSPIIAYFLISILHRIVMTILGTL